MPVASGTVRLHNLMISRLPPILSRDDLTHRRTSWFTSLAVVCTIVVFYSKYCIASALNNGKEINERGVRVVLALTWKTSKKHYPDVFSIDCTPSILDGGCALDEIAVLIN